MKNPFMYGREMGHETLVDRESEVSEVLRVIEEGNKLFMVGPRRYGKTSILAVAQQKAQEGGAVVLRYNAEAYPSLRSLAQVMVADAAQRLTGTLEKAGEAIRIFFASLQPTATYNAIDQSWSVSLATASAGDAGEPVLLVDVLNGVHELARGSGRSSALIIDEFQQIIQEEGVAAERQIRAAIQQHEHMAYIFAGSATRFLTGMTEDPSRPFYRLGARLFIGPVPRADFRVFLRRGFEAAGLSTEEEAVEEILNLAEDVPHNVQRLAHSCWNRLRGAEESVLSVDQVRDTLDHLVLGDDPFYTQIWNRLTRIQKNALLSVIRQGGTNLYTMEILRSLNVAQSTMQRAMAALEDVNILRTEESLGSKRLRLEDPFFAAWIRIVVEKPL